MASPAVVGQCRGALVLEQEQQQQQQQQQLFWQRLGAHEKKQLLQRFASGEPKAELPRQPSRGEEEEEEEEGAHPLRGQAGAPGTGQQERSAAAERSGAPRPAAHGRRHRATDGVAQRAMEAAPDAPAAAKPRRSGGGGGGSGGLLCRRFRLRSASPRQLPDVRTIFEQPRDPRVREETGEGHRFRAFLALARGWCDLCGEAVEQRALRCANCKYTCHQECRSLIQLDCIQQEGQTLNRPSPESTLTQSYSQNVTKTLEEEETRAPTIQELKEKIDKYNAKVNNCLLMKLNDDDTYTGFIKVHLKLRRPVTVPAGIRPQSIYDALKEVNLAKTTEKRTSFYLPLDAIKQLHISSTTTVSEVIQGLLKKFMVVDNPQKFALFKQVQKDGQVLSQKLPVTEYPLYLRLQAGPDTDLLSFVLKENETGEVEWDDFSIPELQNFLVILEREEKEKIQQVQKKYDRFKQKLQEVLKEANGNPG